MTIKLDHFASGRQIVSQDDDGLVALLNSTGAGEAVDTTFINSEDDLPDAVGGDITLPAGQYVVRAASLQLGTDRLVISDVVILSRDTKSLTPNIVSSHPDCAVLVTASGYLSMHNTFVSSSVGHGIEQEAGGILDLNHSIVFATTGTLKDGIHIGGSCYFIGSTCNLAGSNAGINVASGSLNMTTANFVIEAFGGVATRCVTIGAGVTITRCSNLNTLMESHGGDYTILLDSGTTNTRPVRFSSAFALNQGAGVADVAGEAIGANLIFTDLDS